MSQKAKQNGKNPNKRSNSTLNTSTGPSGSDQRMDDDANASKRSRTCVFTDEERILIMKGMERINSPDAVTMSALNDMMNGIRELIAGVNSKVIALEARVKALEEQELLSKEKDFQRKIELDMIQAEVNKNVLIITGIDDRLYERDDELRNKVSRLFRTLLQKETENDPDTDTHHNNNPNDNENEDDNALPEFSIDSCYRLGGYRLHQNRPIKIRFRFLSERDRIFGLRMGTDKGKKIFINEDLPKNIRIIHGILRKKGKELTASGIDNKMLYSKNILEAGNMFYKVNFDLTVSSYEKPAMNKLHQNQHHVNSQQQNSSGQV